MLALIYGVWINVALVTNLVPYDDDRSCWVVVQGNSSVFKLTSDVRIEKTCDEVAAEINKAWVKK